jgi:hypothetical protein
MEQNRKSPGISIPPGRDKQSNAIATSFSSDWKNQGKKSPAGFTPHIV